MPSAAASPRPLTGRKVFLCFAAFFGTIFAADAFLLTSALRTWSGLEAPSAYKAGQAYNRDLERARQGDGLGWRLESRTERDGAGGLVLLVAATEGADRPLARRTVKARFERPTDRRADREVVLQEEAPGRYRGSFAELASGQWDLVLDVLEDGEARLRRKSRLVLR